MQSYGHDQAEDPMRIHHPEEEEHQEKGASKVLKKVKEKAKKIKNSLTKHGHGHEHDHDADEEDNEYDEPEVHGAPVYESSAVRGGVTGQPESLSHPGQADIPAPEDIIPPGTKVFPVVTSDHTRPIEPEPSREATYGHHEAPSRPLADMSERGETREAHHMPTYTPLSSLPLGDVSERGESRETNHIPMNTPSSLLSSTEDVTSTFAPGKDDYLGGQRKVNVERPKGGLEEDPAGPGGGSDYLSSVPNYESKVTDPAKQGGGEAGVPGIVESLGKMKVTDESPRRKSGRDFEREFPAGFGGESGAGLGKEFPTRGLEFDQKTESGVNNDSPMVLQSGSLAGLGEDFPTRSHESERETESGFNKNWLTGFSGEQEAPLRSRELGKDSPRESHGYGKEGEYGVEKNVPLQSEDVKVPTGLGRDLPTGTHDQFSPGLSPPKERDDAGSKFEESHEAKPNTYTEKFASATSAITDKAIAAKNAVASKLGYAEEATGGAGGVAQHESTVGAGGGGVQHGSTVGEETSPRSATGYGQKVAGAVTGTLAPVYEKVKETGSNVMTKLPFSGGGRGADMETQLGVDKGVGVGGGGVQHESAVGEETSPRAATGYGQKVVGTVAGAAGTVAGTLAPVYEKVKETGSNVMTKLPISGGGGRGTGTQQGGAETETQQGVDKGVSPRNYLAEKLRPGEEDKALSEVIAEKLHLGGGEKKTKTTKEVEVTVEKIPSDQVLEEREHGEVIGEEGKGGGGGMVGKVKGAVTSWLGGTKDETEPKLTSSGEEASQSLGSTVGTKGFSDSGGAVSTQRGLQQSGN